MMGNTPNIRFKGFTDDWEQRKLIDYLEVSSEKNRDNRFTKETSRRRGYSSVWNWWIYAFG